MKKLIFLAALIAGLFFSNQTWAQASKGPEWPVAPLKNSAVITVFESDMPKKQKSFYVVKDPSGTSERRPLFDQYSSRFSAEESLDLMIENALKNSEILAAEFDRLFQAGYRLQTSKVVSQGNLPSIRISTFIFVKDGRP